MFPCFRDVSGFKTEVYQMGQLNRGGAEFVYASGLDHSFFLIFRKTGRHLFLQCFKFGKAMYIIRNKIRVICSKIRVGMEGGPFSIGGSIFHRGIWAPGSMGSIFRGVHI